MLTNETKGIVYLVGAGPGDPGLLTLRARHCLETAEVVVHDRLLSNAVLGLASSAAEFINVGKEAGHHPVPQAEINQILVECGQAGKRVVRLKGGDPFLFGRGGEEALELRTAGIPFEIIPGVTSALAVPAYAGIPVTHRGLSSGVTVITGHEMEGKKSAAVNWNALAQSGTTLVFLMGVANLAQIVDRLTAEGLASNTPAAVIENGTMPSQRIIRGKLAEIHQIAVQHKLASPAVVVIGPVAELTEKLNWFGTQRPLLGRQILIPRPIRQTEALAELIREAGGEPVCLPTIQVLDYGLEAAGQIIAALSGAAWLVFTSVNGVQGFFKILHASGLDTRALHGVKVAAIGGTTAQALAEQGISADVVPQQFTSADLCRQLTPQVTGKKVILLRVHDAPGELAESLCASGAAVEEYPVYRVETESRHAAEINDLLRQKKINTIVFTSPSTIKGLLENINNELQLLQDLKLVCIGPVTAKYAVSQHLKVDGVAANSSNHDIIAILKKVL